MPFTRFYHTTNSLFICLALCLATSLIANADDIDSNDIFSDYDTIPPTQLNSESAAPDIQMWNILGFKERLRRQPPAGTFADFRQGSIDFWLKYDPQWLPDSDRGTVVALSNGYDTLFEVSLSAGGDGIFMSSGESDGFGGSNTNDNFVSADFTDELIHHVALVTQGEITEVYVDGQHAGTASIGYVLAEDAQGQKRNLQLAIGSLDNKNNLFEGGIGAVRIWGAPLPAEALLSAAFLRDQELLSLEWAQNFLIAHLDNIEEATTKPRLNFLKPMFRPEGVWMTAENDNRKLLHETGGKFDVRNWTYTPQSYVQLILTPYDSALASYAKGQSGELTKNTILSEASAIKDSYLHRPNAAISGHNTKTLSGTVEQCKQYCSAEKGFNCLSFDYDKTKNKCDLSKQRAATVGGLKTSYKNNPYDHYERVQHATKSANTAFITEPKLTKASAVKPVAPKGFSLIANTGVGGRPKQLISNISLEQCAQQCREAESFICASFDYVASVQRCELNDKVIPLRQGINGSNNYQPTTATIATISPKATVDNERSYDVAREESLLAVEKPKDLSTFKLPILVKFEYHPFNSDKGSDSLSVEVFQAAGRNSYRSQSGNNINLSSRIRIKTDTQTLLRKDNYDRPAKRDDTRVDDVFIVSNQIRGKASILNGWNPVYLDPFNYSEPTGGNKASIFKHSIYGFDNGANRVVPLGLKLEDIQSGTGRSKHSEITTESKFRDELGLSFSASASVDAVKGAVAFSANGKYKSASEKLKTGKSAFTMAQATNTRFIILLDKAKIGLTESFRDAVLSKAKNPTLSSAMELINEFGTHYAHAIAMGGRLLEIVELDAESWGHAQASSGAVGAKVDARIGLPATANAQASYSGEVEKKRDIKFNAAVANSESNWVSYGGAGGKDPSTWQISDETTAPIFLDLRPLSEILVPPFFIEPAVFETLRPLVFKAMKQYISQHGTLAEVTENFVPQSIEPSDYEKLQPKACSPDRWSFKKAISTDSKMEGGGAWMRFKLPQAEHSEGLDLGAGCFGNTHWDGAMDALFECNRVCWKRAQFRCVDGEWQSHSLEMTSHKTGCITKSNEDIYGSEIEIGTGLPPWNPIKYPNFMCELMAKGSHGRPSTCKD